MRSSGSYSKPTKGYGFYSASHSSTSTELPHSSDTTSSVRGDQSGCAVLERERRKEEKEGKKKEGGKERLSQLTS